jgi:hypothetical protein
MLNEFLKYVNSFYGPGGLYDMGATPAQIIEATGAAMGRKGWEWGDGDSVDREHVRDIMIERFGLTFPGE